ncbi:MAG TPA: VTT domain-containing protein [Casimicrobiaceae bacterium]|jgi:membrane protein DedA with SNARE-associated domain
MDTALAQLSQYGVWVVGLNVLLQQLGLPIPSVPTMMVAGALASMARLNGPAAFALSVCASLVADLAWFWAGRRFGYPVLRFLCKVSLSPDMCVRQTEGIFERWGFYSVVLSKFVPGFSTVAPPIAGALRMPTASFVMASIASAGLWVGVAMGVGYLFAPQIELVLAWMAAHVAFAALAVAVVVAAYVIFKAWQRWRLARFVNAALIDIDDLRAALEREPRPFLVDIGSRLAQQSRPHIPGAALLDLEAMARLDDFPGDRDIVVYCACPNEASAKRAAQILLGRGYTRVRPLRGGLDAWMRAGHPVEQGATVRFTPRASRSAEKTPA